MEYTLTKKRVKNIILRVDRFGNIKVSAPFWVQNQVIQEFILSKKEWIESRQKTLKKQKYYSNQEILYFDDVYMLNIIKYQKNQICLSDNILSVYVKNPSDIKSIEKLIIDFFIRSSNSYICGIISKYSNVINKEVKVLKFRTMTTRWGSCNSSKAIITLNTILFRKPRICLEYVLLHELIHLIHPNHGIEFYKLLETLMPNWRKIKTILET